MEIPTFPVLRSPQSERYLVPTSVFIRAIAYLIDVVLIGFAAVIVLYATGVDTDSFAQSLSAGTVSNRTLEYFLYGSIAAQILYFFIWEAAVGWTPGKRAMQLKVVRLDGRPCGVAHSFVRNVIRPIDLLAFGLIGALSIAVGLQRQRLGDRLASTQVVREVPLALIPPPYVPADTATRRCPRCGLLNMASAKHCQACGVNMDEAERSWQQAIPPFFMGPFGTQPSGTPVGQRPSGDEAYDETDRYEGEDAYDDEYEPVGDPADQGRYEPEDETQPEADEVAQDDEAAVRRAGTRADGAAAQDGGVDDAGGTPGSPGEGGDGDAPGADAGRTPRQRPQGQPAARPRAGAAAAAQRRTTVRRPDRTHFLDDEDEWERSASAREILLDGTKDEVRTLARILPKWHEEDREFVIAVARTLDGWRPTVVLEALRNDSDPEVQEAAREALERVAERTAQKRQPYQSPDD